MLLLTLLDAANAMGPPAEKALIGENPHADEYGERDMARQEIKFE